MGLGIKLNDGNLGTFSADTHNTLTHTQTHFPAGRKKIRMERWLDRDISINRVLLTGVCVHLSKCGCVFEA